MRFDIHLWEGSGRRVERVLRCRVPPPNANLPKFGDWCVHVSTHSTTLRRTGHGDGTAARRPRTIKIGGPANVYVGSVRLQIESASLKITVKSRTIGHTTVRQVGPMVLGWHTHAPLGH